MTKKYRKTLKGLALALSAVLLLAVALAGCDSGLNDSGTSGGGGAGGGGTNPGSGTDESPLWSKPDVKKLYGILSVSRGDDLGDYLVKAVDQAQSKSTGTGTVGVDAFHDTNRYRIPSATVIPGGKYAGRLLVISDARFGSRADLPAKASTWVRYSDDHGKTWSNIATVSDFDDTDMSGARTAPNYQSVSTGDSAIGADSKGYVYSISTFVAPKTGNTSGGTSTASGTPYVYIDGEWWLRLRKNTERWTGNLDETDWENGDFSEGTEKWVDYAGETNQGSSAVYVYAAPVKGGQLRKLINSTSPSLGDRINVWIDEYYYLYKDAGKSQKITAHQLKTESSSSTIDAWDSGGNNQVTISIDTSKPLVHQHLFMPMSPYQVWRGGTFLGMTRSKDGGQTWEKTKDITYMTNSYIAGNTANADLDNKKVRQFICPTRGFEIENGPYKGQVVFALYTVRHDQSQHVETSAVIRTPDGGDTWIAGRGFSHGSGNTSKGESAVVEAPNGDLILISRNDRSAGSYPTYSISTDGGDTWTDKGVLWTGSKTENDPLYSCGNLISAINLRFSTSKLSGVPLIAFSLDSGGGVMSSGTDSERHDGKVWIAALEGNAGNWSFNFKPDTSEYVTLPYGVPIGGSKIFHYSSLVETFDGNLFSAYEGSAWAGQDLHGGPVIDYAHFTLDRK